MKIGLYIRLFGRPGTEPPPPGWASIREQALAAEAAGFDSVVFEDAAMYPGEGGPAGVWEAMSVAAAVAAATTRIGIGHAVVNNPYRHPALVARTAATLDEISGGRYTLGIGLGNTPDDYEPFGVDVDHRFSRLEEAIEIIGGLLRDGRVAFTGSFYRAPDAVLPLRGPRAAGPPIVIAGKGPRMLDLAARRADGWNWWTAARDDADLPSIVAALDAACVEADRDPATLPRSLDVFSVAAPGDTPPGEAAWLSGTEAEISDGLVAYRSLGFEEVRCDLRVGPGLPRTEAIGRMAGVVARVRAA